MLTGSRYPFQRSGAIDFETQRSNRRVKITSRKGIETEKRVTILTITATTSIKVLLTALLFFLFL